ncbi:MAG: hypothetical protein FJ403_11010 [Verrucomicrobia bacterium]|nr:hypothetical protein [Verrucomicrobiota bacterium]
MTPENNREPFLTLLSVVRENQEERRKLLSLLDLEPTRRKMAINVLVMNMRRENAPSDFIEAWDSLQDHTTAENTKRILEDRTLDGRCHRLTTAMIIGTAIACLGLFWAVYQLLF